MISFILIAHIHKKTHIPANLVFRVWKWISILLYKYWYCIQIHVKKLLN